MRRLCALCRTQPSHMSHRQRCLCRAEQQAGGTREPWGWRGSARNKTAASRGCCPKSAAAIARTRKGWWQQWWRSGGCARTSNLGGLGYFVGVSEAKPTLGPIAKRQQLTLLQTARCDIGGRWDGEYQSAIPCDNVGGSAPELCGMLGVTSRHSEANVQVGRDQNRTSTTHVGDDGRVGVTA